MTKIYLFLLVTTAAHLIYLLFHQFIPTSPIDFVQSYVKKILLLKKVILYMVQAIQRIYSKKYGWLITVASKTGNYHKKSYHHHPIETEEPTTLLLMHTVLRWADDTHATPSSNLYTRTQLNGQHISLRCGLRECAYNIKFCYVSGKLYSR